MFIITEEKPTYGERKQVEIFRFETYAEACIKYEKIQKENQNSWSIFRILKIEREK